MVPKKVLICDDDEGIVDVATIVLEEAGYSIIPLTTSRDVYEKVKSHMPQLILLDLWMPHMSGEEVSNLIKNDPEIQHIPVILVSASRNTEETVKTAKADGFLKKPFDIDELEEIVRKYI